MSMIDVVDLTFAYDGSYDNIFEQVSFRIDTDWKLGFTGRNGRGKTTFLNLLMGKYEYRGTIKANVKFDYFPFPVGDVTRNTCDIVEEAYPDYEMWKLMKELSKLKVPDEVLFRPFDTLSHGEQTKVLLAILFLKDNNFLLIDEPTNHLDREAREVVGDYLNAKKGFLLVSHDRAFLDRCTDHILAINKTNIEIQKGNFTTWYGNKKAQDEFEMSENERMKKNINRLSLTAKRTKVWADEVEATKIGKKSNGMEKSIDSRAYIGEKSRRLQQRRKNLERRQQAEIEEKSKLLKNIESMDVLKLSPAKYYTERLAVLDNIGISYGGRQICREMGFCIKQGDRISLQGKNGCGKSSLLKLILGEEIPYNGKLQKASNLIISYVSQDTSFLKGNLSDYAREAGIDESLFKAMLRKLDFSRIQFDKEMEMFSEGQKKKVLIARSLCEKAHLYIWDEPLNFIDIYSRIQIENLLMQYQPTLLFVEHDRVFTETIATEIITM